MGSSCCRLFTEHLAFVRPGAREGTQRLAVGEELVVAPAGRRQQNPAGTGDRAAHVLDWGIGGGRKGGGREGTGSFILQVGPLPEGPTRGLRGSMCWIGGIGGEAGGREKVQGKYWCISSCRTALPVSPILHCTT